MGVCRTAFVTAEGHEPDLWLPQMHLSAPEVCASGTCWSTWGECLNGLCTSGTRPNVACLGTQNAFSFCVSVLNTGVPPCGGNMCSC